MAVDMFGRWYRNLRRIEAPPSSVPLKLLCSFTFDCKFFSGVRCHANLLRALHRARHRPVQHHASRQTRRHASRH